MIIDISEKKILFLGYGGVAKCVWNYFDHYFTYNTENIYIVDKCGCTIAGPKLDSIKKENIFVQEINAYNFDVFLEKNGFAEGDIIIDLTVMSNTYFFIYRCFMLGINYINTSIEDMSDKYLGTSIDFQQKTVHNIYETCKKNTKIRSNILTECGQNPGLIQHYVFYALNEMNKMYKNTSINDYNKATLLQAVDNYKIGTIFCSEIDNLLFSGDTCKTREELYKDKFLDHGVIYNTWSVGGLLVEGFDKTELVYRGAENNYIKPVLDISIILKKKSDLLKNEDYQILFLNESGINNSLNSICPVLEKTGEIKYTEYEGKLIHHGEVFELAKYFGKKAPFMSYVYKINKYADMSLRYFMEQYPYYDATEIHTIVKSQCNSFKVLNNINKPDNQKIVGHDSIGCTIYCGENTVERIFWCGSILSDNDPHVDSHFTPTIVQVAAGVLSGLSFLLEDKNKNIGLLEPCDLDTPYMIEKSKHLLGKFFFTEIPTTKFSNRFSYSVEKII